MKTSNCRLRDLLRERKDVNIICPLGGGSFGIVSKAFDLVTKRICAFKEIGFSQNDDDLCVDYEYFFREVTSLFSFSSHKGMPLLSLVGFGFPTKNNNAFILTEFVNGGDISRIIQRNITPATHPTEITKIIYGIAFGLYILHKGKLIHRDIKPANILLTESLEPIIADFGFMKLMEDLKQTAEIGSLQYMAPEILDGNYGTPVDCYSFAVVVLELFVKNLQRDTKSRRYVIPYNVPPDYKMLIENCWKHNPNSRWTMKQVIDMMKSGEFHLEGCNEEVFEEYVKRLDEAESNGSTKDECENEEETKEFDFS